MTLRNKQDKTFKFDKRVKSVKIGADVKVSGDNYIKLLNYLNARMDEYDYYRSELVCRMEEVDRILGGYEDCAEQQESEAYRRQARKRNEGNPLKRAKLNLTLDRLNDALTAIMGILFPHHSFYRVTGEPEDMQKAHALARMLNKEARRFKHYSEISKIVMRALKYNLTGGLVEWEELYGRTFSNDDVPGTTLDTENGSVVFEGNRISALDVYNIGWDMSVDIEDLARDGEYLWQIKRESLHTLRKRVYVDETIYGPKEFKSSLKDLVADMSNIRSNALKNADFNIESEFPYFSNYASGCRYHERKTFVYNGRNNVSDSPTQMDWNAWARGGAKAHETFGTAEVSQIWIKLNPADFGMGKENKIETWYFEIVNDVYIVYAAKIGANNAPLPVFLMTLSDHTDVVDKAISEQIMPLQQIGEKLISAHFQSVIKKLGNGNTFVRKGLINAEKLASNTHGVHEVDSVDHDKPLSYHIHKEAETPNTEGAIDDYQAISAIAREAIPTSSGKVMTDLDRATKHQSQTVKFENSRLMNHFAALLDDRGFSDMRIIMRDNELINREEFFAGYAPNKEGEPAERITFTPDDLREVDLTVSNGLMNIDRFAVMSAIENIINFAIQSGERNRFDMVGLLDYYSDYAGVEVDLSQFIEQNPLNQLDPQIQEFLTQAAQNGQLEQIIAAIQQQQQGAAQ